MMTFCSKNSPNHLPRSHNVFCQQDALCCESPSICVPLTPRNQLLDELNGLALLSQALASHELNASSSDEDVSNFYSPSTILLGSGQDASFTSKIAYGEKVGLVLEERLLPRSTICTGGTGGTELYVAGEKNGNSGLWNSGLFGSIFSSYEGQMFLQNSTLRGGNQDVIVESVDRIKVTKIEQLAQILRAPERFQSKVVVVFRLSCATSSSSTERAMAINEINGVFVSAAAAMMPFAVKSYDSDTDNNSDSEVEMSTGRWTDHEHNLFLSGSQKFGTDYRKIQQYVRTRTVLQVRTHAQKHYKKSSSPTPSSDPRLSPTPQSPSPPPLPKFRSSQPPRAQVPQVDDWVQVEFQASESYAATVYAVTPLLGEDYTHMLSIIYHIDGKTEECEWPDRDLTIITQNKPSRKLSFKAKSSSFSPHSASKKPGKSSKSEPRFFIEPVKKDPNRPKKNMSAYHFFLAANSKRIKAENMNSCVSVLTLTANLFKTLKGDSLQIWTDRAAADKARYRRAMSNYATPPLPLPLPPPPPPSSPSPSPYPIDEFL